METISRRVWSSKQTEFKWIQLHHSLAKPWIKQIFIDSRNPISLAIQDHHLIKKIQILCLNKLDSKELYNKQLLANFLKPTSQAYFDKLIFFKLITCLMGWLTAARQGGFIVLYK